MSEPYLFCHISTDFLRVIADNGTPRIPNINVDASKIDFPGALEVPTGTIRIVTIAVGALGVIVTLTSIFDFTGSVADLK